jgi:hypothetical protein
MPARPPCVHSRDIHRYAALRAEAADLELDRLTAMVLGKNRVIVDVRVDGLRASKCRYCHAWLAHRIEMHSCSGAGPVGIRRPPFDPTTGRGGSLESGGRGQSLGIRRSTCDRDYPERQYFNVSHWMASILSRIRPGAAQAKEFRRKFVPAECDPLAGLMMGAELNLVHVLTWTAQSSRD